MTSLPEPLFYRNMLRSLLDARNTLPRVLLSGGRGLGKTTFLHHIADSVKSRRTVTFISGRQPEAEKLLFAWKPSPRGLLLIDDLDRIMTSDVELFLRSLPEDPDRVWIIATSRRSRSATAITAIGPNAYSDKDDSSAIKTFHPKRLDPWAGGQYVVIRDHLQRLLSVRDESAAMPWLSNRTAVIEAWSTALLETTGGHPALLGSALDGLHYLATHTTELTGAERYLLAWPGDKIDDWMRSLRAYIEDYIVDTGSFTIDLAIEALRRSEPIAFGALLQMASGNYPDVLNDPTTREILRNSGLVHRADAMNKLDVAGDLIRRRLSGLATTRPTDSSRSAPREAVRLEVTADSSVPMDKGLLRCYRHGAEPLEVVVVGGAWRMLKTLAEASGRPVSIAELKETLSLESEAAVRSAIQRLVAATTTIRLMNVVVNVRGEGYCLGTQPVLIP